MPRPGPRTTYKYSDRFKATAVRLSPLRGVAVQDVADSLYIHPFMLSRWRKQARDGLIVPWVSDQHCPDVPYLVFANYWRFADGDQLMFDLSDSSYPVVAYLHEHGPLFEAYAP